MSEKIPEKTADPPVAEPSSKPSGAESPRTAKELDFDDDVHEALPVPERQSTPKGTKRVSFQDDDTNPPAKPPRPLSPQAHAEATLIEAFPSIDAKVVKAVLIASGGKVEPAFNALLAMSDPNYEQEMAPPPVPRKAPTKSMSQLESDELYARQLSEHYNSSYTGFGARGSGEPPLPRRRQQNTDLKPNEMHGDKEHSFFDDDLPEIKKNIQQGFEETKNTISKWFTDFQRKLDGDESNDPIPRPGGSQQHRRQNYGPSQSNQLYGIQKSAESSRRSAERDRYDHDPQLISDDFAHRLELRDDEAPPSRPPRPLANPELFKSGDSVNPTSLKSIPGRTQSPATGSGKTGGKWQPLSSVEPKSELEDHDPFSLGDSDEEPESAKKDVKTTETTSTTTTPATAATSSKVETPPVTDKEEEGTVKVESKS